MPGKSKNATVQEEHENPHQKIIANQVTDLLKGTIEIITEYRCKYHPGLAATAVCEVCRADLCPDCSNIRSHKLVCPKCMGALDKALGGTGIAAYCAKLLTHPFVVALVLATLLALVFVRMGSSQRKGLLGAIPDNALESERQFRLKLLLFAKKADRIETHADALYEIGRFDRAAREYGRAKTIHETLIDDTKARWEQPVFGLARARIMEKMGQEQYAKGLYKNIAAPVGPDRTYQVSAQLHLARLQEKSDPDKALATYRSLLKNIQHVPDKFTAALDIMAHSDRTYNYKSRIHAFTRTNADFDEMKAEALLRMGLLLLNMGRQDEAEYRLSRAAAEAGGTRTGKWAASELHKLRAIKALKESTDESRFEEKKEEKEKAVITHF